MTVATFMMTVALAAQAPQQPNAAPQQPPSQPPAAAPQQPPSQPASQPPSQTQRQAEPAAAKITLNGCIEKAEQPAAGGFLLTNAMAGPASSTSGGAVGTTGSASRPSASPSSSSAETTYRLDADSAQLTQHVGHRVEIVGTSAPSSAARSAEPGGRPAPPSLKVESIKMVAQNCDK
jgi:hypothetical protein